MDTAEDSDRRELQHLRARAYAAGAMGLTAQEHARLDELETAHRAARVRPAAAAGVATTPAHAAARASSPAPSSMAVSAPAAPSESAVGVPRATVIEAESITGEQAAAQAAAAVERARRPLLMALIGLAALIPLVGIGTFFAGALVSTGGGALQPAAGDSVTALPVAAEFGDDEIIASREQARTRQQWDDDTVALLGGAGGYLVWWGTIDAGTQTCIVVDGEEFSGVSVCEPSDSVRESGLTFGAELMLVEGPQGVVGDADPQTRLIVSVAAYPYSGALIVDRQSTDIEDGAT